MYEFIVLAQLMHGPMHGYLIAKIINDMIGPYARLSYGRLYPLLAKLEQSGLIEVVSEGKGGKEAQPHDRNLRRYRIMDAGRRRFLFLMNDTGSNPGDYAKLFMHKVSAFAFIRPAERLRLIDHYINYCQAHVFHMQSETEELVRRVAMVEEWHPEKTAVEGDFPHMDHESLEYIVGDMQHAIDQWEREIAWARSLREKEVARMEQAGEVPPSQIEGKVAGSPN
jgi:DNA-binding PadR family transcriptional regulator